MGRFLLKTIKYLTIAIATAIATCILFVYIFQDRIIDKAIAVLNEQLATPVTVKNISIDAFSDFPYVQLKLRDITVQESFPGSSSPLALADELYISFSIKAFFSESLFISNIKLLNGTVTLKTDKNGRPNYEILKKQGNGGSADIAIGTISLEQIHITYLDGGTDQLYDLTAITTSGKLNYAENKWNIALRGDLLCNQLLINDQPYFRSKYVQLDGALLYDEEKRTLIFPDQVLKINEAPFYLAGQIELARDQLDLEVEGKDTDIKSLLALLPSSLTADFTKYKSSGDVYFNATLSGKLQSPHITASFGATRAELTIPEADLAIRNISLTGLFDNGARNTQVTSILEIRDLTGNVDGNPLAGQLKLTNLTNPHLAFSLNTSGKSSLITQLVDFSPVKIEGGSFTIDLEFDGNISDLKSPKDTYKWATNGELVLDDVSLKLPQLAYPLESVSGTFIFNNEDLAIGDASFTIDKSDFLLNGYFNNLTGYFFQDKPIIMQADLQSGYLDLAVFLVEKSAGDNKYSFTIQPNIYFDFSCSIDHLTFDRFHGKNVNGAISIKNQVLVGRNLQLNTMNGRMMLNGIVDARNPSIRVNTSSTYEGIMIDSLFYVFKNWDQEYLTHRNIKGETDATVTAYMEFDTLLNLDDASLEATVDAIINGGQLLDFEPMLALSRFVEEEELAQLTFGTLQNQISIKDRMIYIPNMNINSNVANIELSGTHSFDQAIDYHFKVPLKNFRKKDRDMRYGDVEVMDNYTNVFLKMTGTADDFTFAWDKKATTNQLKSRFQQILKGQEEKNSRRLLEEEELDIGGN